MIIYAIVFLVISVLIAFKVDAEGLIGQAAGIISVTVAAYFLAQKVDLKNIAGALGYGVLTAVIVLALDFLITKKFNSDFDPFAVNILIGYAVIVLAPVAVKQVKK